MRLDAVPVAPGLLAPCPVEPAVGLPGSDGGGLVARGRELHRIDQLLSAARQGQGGAVVVRGEPGTGKTALLEAAIRMASGLSIVRVSGADASHHGKPESQLARILELLAYRDASPSHFPAGHLATLDRFAMTRELVESLGRVIESTASPMLFAVDDAHLIASEIVSALADAVKELVSVPIAMVLTWRDIPHALADSSGIGPLEQWHVGGLTVEQAAAVLSMNGIAAPEASVLKSVVAGTAGNPYGVIEVCSTLCDDERDGWRPLPRPLPIGDVLTAAYGACLADLPEQTHQALAVVAAGGRAPLDVVTEAMGHMGLTREAIEPACQQGILQVAHQRVECAHPLVGASAFHLAERALQIEIRAALARVLMARGDVESAALSMAGGCSGPDDRVARMLTQASCSALDRRDMASAASFEEAAAGFVESSEGRAYRLVSAADLWTRCGRPFRALELLAVAESVAVSKSTRVEVACQRAQALLASDIGPATVASLSGAAAMACEAVPQRAAAMLVDAAACSLLTDQLEEAVLFARQAIDASAPAPDHVENLAVLVLDAVGGSGNGLAASRSRPSVALPTLTVTITAPMHGFQGSPVLALAVGMEYFRRDDLEELDRWTARLRVTGEASGERAMLAVALLLRSLTRLGRGRLTDAATDAENAYRIATACGNRTLVAHALTALVEVESVQGRREQCLQHAALLSAPCPTGASVSLVQGMRALAELALQRGDPEGALAWLRAGNAEMIFSARERGSRYADSLSAGLPGPWLSVLVESLALSGRREHAASILARRAEACPARLIGRARHAFLRGLMAESTDDVSSHFSDAVLSASDLPLLRARVELRWGQRMEEMGGIEEAIPHLERAHMAFASLGAPGWARLADIELGRLRSFVRPVVAMPAGDESMRAAHGGPAARRLGVAERGELDQAPILDGTPVAPAAWQVMMLGSFVVSHRGAEVRLPRSLPAQAIKIAALRGSIPVEELIELLWPEAAPGVGARRLRNVLLRVRKSCGELLVRDFDIIRISPECEIDVSRYRALARRALKDSRGERGGSPSPDAVSIARQAVEIYKGELLPADRYEDWALSYREMLRQLQVRLLDLLVAESTARGSPGEALAMLDELIEIDPYEERHYRMAAQLHAEAGNRGRAMSLVAQAERVMLDLGIAPSQDLSTFRRTIGQLAAVE
ncbi:MAG: AAA family ATPase [Acidimicrobiales bacterium]